MSIMTNQISSKLIIITVGGLSCIFIYANIVNYGENDEINYWKSEVQHIDVLRDDVLISRIKREESIELLRSCIQFPYPRRPELRPVDESLVLRMSLKSGHNEILFFLKDAQGLHYLVAEKDTKNISYRMSYDISSWVDEAQQEATPKANGDK